MEISSKKKSSKSAKETDNLKSSNEELIKREEIEDTPFMVITTEGKSFGVMGRWRITEDKENEWQVKDELKKMTWNRITQVILLLMEDVLKKNKSENNH